MSKIYKTARGVPIDMGKLINQNEMAVAVGNMNVNARGDKLGPGGQVIKKNEELQINTVRKAKDVKDMDPEGDE